MENTPRMLSRATMAQSTVRRFARWLNNERIVVHQLYGPLIQQALAEWGQHVLNLALDTSMLWDCYCLVRISVIYRGRAVPLVWLVLEHGSSSVAYEVYKTLLDQAARLLPLSCRVVFLADRGFVDTDLMAHLQLLHWHWRTYLATPTTGLSSAMSRRTCRPSMNMACASTLKRISWTINQMASSWRPP
jgi:hypothetical protein